jgi:hypothetical protein
MASRHDLTVTAMTSCRHAGGGRGDGKRRATEFRSVREYSSGGTPQPPAHCPDEPDRAEHDPKAGGDQHQAQAAFEHEAGVADKSVAMPRKIRPHGTADQPERERAGQSQFQPVNRAVPDLRLADSARSRGSCCCSGPFRARGRFRVRRTLHVRGPFRLPVLFRAPGWLRIRRSLLVRRPLGARGLFRAGAPAIGRARVPPAGRFAPGWRYRE